MRNSPITSTPMPEATDPPAGHTQMTDITTNLEKYAVMRFASAAARDAAIPTPVNGQMCYVDGVREFQVFTDRTSPPSWRKPWSQPWGIISYNPAGQSNTQGPIYIAGAAFGLPVAGRQYKLTWRCMATKDANGANVRYTINVNNAAVLYAEQPMPAGQVWSCEITAVYSNPTAGLGGGVIVEVFGGTLVDTGWGRMLVEDIGPA